MAENYKGKLQELFQTKRVGQCRSPEYRELEWTGDPHMPVHTILLTAMWDRYELSVVKSARNKADAEKEAAKEMYETIQRGGAALAFNAARSSSVAPSAQYGGNDNAKNDLQEIVQKQSGHPVPSYEELFRGGPPHQRVFRVMVTARWNGEVLVEEGQGNSKKAADKNAAERLLMRIRGRRPPPLPPLGEGDDMISDSEEMATSAKGKLQELLQKRGYPLPSYKLTNRDGPSHQPTFTVTLTVKNKANRTLYTKEASASQLKEAEKMCAMLALPEVEVLLDDVQSDDEFEMPPCSPRYPTVPSSSRWDLDGDQLRRLARFTPHTPEVLCEAGQEGTVLCLVSVKVKDGSCEVVAQGSGATQGEAVQCGMDNLIHNMENCC